MVISIFLLTGSIFVVGDDDDLADDNGNVDTMSLIVM